MSGFGSVFAHGLLLLLLIFISCSSGAEVVTIDVHEAKGLIQNGHVYLDVRTVEEFEKGHADVDKIINIPYMLDTPKGMVRNPEFLNKVSSACNKQEHLIVGCLSGVRSLYASVDLLANFSTAFSSSYAKGFRSIDAIFEKLNTESQLLGILHLITGFKNVNNMGGGYLDWVKKEFPVQAVAAKEDL